jgi:hypothetical protein
VGSLAAGAAAVTGTGAFTSVTANRDVDLAIANDNNAYLQLQPNSEYTYQDSNGQLAFDLTADNTTTGGGQGLNGTADTVIEDAFTIRNQGTQTVYVWVASYDYDSAGNESVEMVAKSQDLTFPPMESKDNQTTQVAGSGNTYNGGFIQLTTGESVNVDLIFHVSGGSGREWEGKSWQFHANADAPSIASAWTDSSLPTHSEEQVSEGSDQDGA